MDNPALDKKPVWSARKSAWALLSVVAAVVWLYWPALGFDFVNWSDPSYVSNNELIQSWTATNLSRIASESVAGRYTPLTVFSLLLDHSIWGLQPTGYHLTNVFLHIINALLVYGLLFQLTRNKYIAWSTSLLFAVHPVQVETVAWISSRTGLLSAAFILSSMLFWFREQRTTRDEGLSIALLLGALLSHPIAIVVPAIFFAFDLLIRRKPASESIVRQFIPGCLALAALGVAFSQMATGGLEQSRLQLLAADTTFMWRYVGLLVCPRDLCVLYNLPTSGIAMAVMVASAGLIAVGGAAWTTRHKLPLATLAVASFYLLLLPALSVFSTAALMNDRHLYLPSIAFFGLASAAMIYVVQSMKVALGHRVAYVTGVACTAAAAVFMMMGTASYLPTWKNSISLWGRAMEQAPELMVVRVQHARAMHEQGRELDAMRVLSQALGDCPRDSADRPQMESLLEKWLRASSRRDIKRRNQAQRVEAGGLHGTL